MQGENLQTPQPQQQPEQKKERIDELDVMGGFVFTFLHKIGSFLKGMITPKKVE